MTQKQKLIRRLITENGGKAIITQNKATKLLGIGKTRFYAMMEGYDYKIGGKNGAKCFLVDDVAEAYLGGAK